MIKALVSKEVGLPDSLVLQELPEPVAGEGQILVSVDACGINYPDVLMIQDRYQFKIDRPFAPGIEICGRIESINGETEFSVGDRVVAQVRSGGLAEKAVANVDRAIKVPENIDSELAASIMLTYGTSYHALFERGGLKSGETLLVLGASGGVGLAAVQLAKRAGAMVVAAASTEEKAEVARQAGADRTLVYPTEIDSRQLAKQFKEVCPDGADVIYDPVGGDYAEPAFRSINWQGRYLVVGFAAGIPKLPLNLVLLKGAQLIGVFWGAAVERNAAVMRAEIADILEWVSNGELTPPLPTVYSLEQGGEAIAALEERRAIGKLVVKI